MSILYIFLKNTKGIKSIDSFALKADKEGSNRSVINTVRKMIKQINKKTTCRKKR